MSRKLLDTGFPVLTMFIVMMCLGIATAVFAETSTVTYFSRTGYIDRVYIGRQTTIPLQSNMAILYVEHDTGATPDPLTNKVDVFSGRLVPNDQIVSGYDSISLRAGSGDTRVIELLKCAATGTVLTNDSSSVWIGLYPVIDGLPALPTASGQRPAPHGRLLTRLHPFEQGQCHAVIKAAPAPSEDILVIAQPGLAPVFIPVRYY